MSNLQFAVLVVALVTVTRACSPEGYVHLSPIEKVHRNDIVVLGRVTAKYPDPRWSTAYSVDVDVQCVLKSTVNNIQNTIRVDEAGKLLLLYIFLVIFYLLL